jgi:hypothetical protein
VLCDTEAPELLLNKNLGDAQTFLDEPKARAIVLPMAMRQVLQRLWLANIDVEQEDDEDEWAQRWFRFAENCAGDDKRANGDQPAMLAWVDRACAGFATRFGLLDRMLPPVGESA